ncbi:MAG: hypothetical protein HQK66_12350 [Desulfamplus sp.]|nr:hypothetical protein [Desulfamplus sp.]
MNILLFQKIKTNHQGDGLNIYCFRKSRRITREMECRTCFFRRRCRAFQLWLQPELPFTFKMRRPGGELFDAQNEIALALDTLYPSEYSHLKRMALKELPHADPSRDRVLIRLKMYDILTGAS